MHQPLVEIKKTCQAVLEKKDLYRQGNYCQSCRVVVKDFTCMTPREISDYLSKHEVHCGTFNRKDVGTGSFPEKLISYLHTRQLKFAAIALTSLILLLSCKVRRGKIQENGRWDNNTNTSIEYLK